jgi:hypothetical protein
MAGTFDTGGPEASIRTNGDRFEYRVLSALWLTHPTLAKVIVGVTKAIAESAYIKIADKNFDYDWVAQSGSEAGLLKSFNLPSSSTRQQIVNAINQSDIEAVTKERLTRWKRQLAALERYDAYAEEMKAFQALIEASETAVKKHLSLNLREGWIEEKAFLHTMNNSKVRNALEAVACK